MYKRASRGFTLIEVAVIVAVIAIIASIIIISYNTVQTQTRDQDRTADMATLRTALKTYVADNNEYPPACTSDNYACPIANLQSYLVPKYMNAIPHDPKSGWPDYSYVRGNYNSLPAYGILLSYELSPQCKSGVNINPGWWGSGVASCPDGV